MRPTSPNPTAFYLGLYVFTLAIHVVFMNYVLAGTAVLAINGLSGPALRERLDASVHVLKEWLPVMLSGAITAGIAPLLFLQILYKQGYYTANLLLFNRWMSILPILIIGFYSLYLVKSEWLRRRGAWPIAAMSVVPFLCVAFTGYSWTENHLLSVRTPEEWTEFYVTSRQWYYESQLIPRLLVWAFGAVPTMSLVLGWQLWYRQQHGQASASLAARWLARLALGGLVLVSAAAVGYYFAGSDTTRNAFTGPMALPYFLAASVGLALQTTAWVLIAKRGTWSLPHLIIGSVGLLFTLVGMTISRESVRIATLGSDRFEALYPLHREAIGKSGFGWFLLFLGLNAALMVFCFWIVRTQRKPETEPLPVAVSSSE